MSYSSSISASDKNKEAGCAAETIFNDSFPSTSEGNMEKPEQYQKTGLDYSESQHLTTQISNTEEAVSVGKKVDVDRTSTSETNITLNPTIPNPYYINYTCLIIPRFKSHFLIGDLAENLHGWMYQICIAFGWRLELLIIQPEYLQWIITVSPVTSPARFINIIRKQTSARILEEFPRIKKDNPSNDFWAPGYLALPGAQPIYPEMINMVIQQIRKKQGYESNP